MKIDFCENRTKLPRLAKLVETGKNHYGTTSTTRERKDALPANASDRRQGINR
jgi:hypothetical protein